MTSLLEHASINEEAPAIHRAVARLWQAGVTVDWGKYHRFEQRRRVALPTYPFEATRYWAEPAGNAPADAGTGGQAVPAPERQPEAGGHRWAGTGRAPEPERDVDGTATEVRRLREKVRDRMARRKHVGKGGWNPNGRAEG